jgi:hypothetical protein
VVVLFLAVLDLLLVGATAGLAFRRGRALDERELALRNMAYRRGFRLLGLAAVIEIVLLIVEEIALSAGQAGPIFSAVSNGISGRALVALLELLLMTPTMVIAWTDVDRDADELPVTLPGGRRLWLILPVLAAAWLALVAAAPEQTATASTNTSWSTSFQGASCAHFAGGRIVGAQFGASVGMRVEVCWNGSDAFVDGDPAIPLPQSAVDALEAEIPPAERGSLPDPNQLGSGDSGISACGADNLDDFETVSATRCSGVIDSGGTLHYSVTATVAGPVGLGRHDVTLTLVVDRNGHVLQRP